MFRALLPIVMATFTILPLPSPAVEQTVIRQPISAAGTVKRKTHVCQFDNTKSPAISTSSTTYTVNSGSCRPGVDSTYYADGSTFTETKI